jgi:mannose-6-phosphate isomerase
MSEAARKPDAGRAPGRLAPLPQVRVARASAWLLEECFPFWADRAAHPRGGFRERLALDGRPIDDDVSRVRVQARQTYVFSRAALLGWSPDTARTLVQIGVESLLGPCRRKDNLFGRLVRPGVGLIDPQPELYDNAFGLLALAWAARALDAPELIEEADAVLDALDRTRAHPAGGYHETSPPRLPRRQNPHMHLFEACLALYEASGAGRHRLRAARLLELFEMRFLDHVTGQVRELFDDELIPVRGADGDLVEPGHMFEWVALLDAHRRMMGGEPRPYTGRLYAAALDGLDQDGFAPLSVRRRSGPVDASRRTWAQTEALRAHLASAAAGDVSASLRADRLLDAIFEAHLDPAPPGAWIDHRLADGRPCVDSITAATGYHLVGAFCELIESRGVC